MKAVKIQTQAELRRQAERYMPGGVGAAGRFNPALGYALCIKEAKGCRLWDVDGKEYIDFNLAHGSAFLGYKHPATQRAAETALAAGVLSGYETEAHVELAKKITGLLALKTLLPISPGLFLRPGHSQPKRTSPALTGFVSV